MDDYITFENCRIHYIRHGSGPTVVLLHGSPGFLQDYAALMQQTGADRFDLIAFDRPGHGNSSSPETKEDTFSTQLRFIHIALKQLAVSRALLVGHSWSAALCLAYALEYPLEIEGLVLLSPWVYAASDPPSPLIFAADRLGARFSSALLKWLPFKRPLLRRGLKEAFAPAPVPNDYMRAALSDWLRTPEQVRIFVQENLDAWKSLSAMSFRYPQIDVPVIILAGDSDYIVHSDRQAFHLHRDLSNSELIVLPAVGHALPHLRPDAVLEAITHCQLLADAAKQSFTQKLPGEQALPVVTIENSDATRAKARELVFRYGWNATAYQILNPDIKHWFSSDGETVVGYVEHFGTRVAAGAPVCNESLLAEAALQFERNAANEGHRVCWFAAAMRIQNALAEATPHAALVIGAQPVWNPANWPEIIRQNSSLRAQLNRARNKGAIVSEWTPERGASSPGLQRCLDDWLVHHPLPTLRFLTEPVTLNRLKDRRLFVTEREGEPVGFLIATPVPSRNGWLIEQIVRSHDAPNGVAELMVDSAMRALAEDGYEYVTLGLVPLSRRGRVPATPVRFWLSALLTWARLHGQRFYNFEGLDAFKSKFKPDYWEPLFALSNEPRISMRMMMAIAAAFSNGPLLWTMARALLAAASQEAVSLWKRLRASS